MNTKKTNRSPLLAALCILTFIGSTLGFIGFFLAALFFEQSSELIIKYSSWHTVEAISPIYFTLLMALYAFSLTGAIRMWKFHRDGIFLYSAAQLIILLLPAIWIDWSAFSAANAISTGVFIIGYVFSFKYYK